MRPVPVFVFDDGRVSGIFGGLEPDVVADIPVVHYLQSGGMEPGGPEW